MKKIITVLFAVLAMSSMFAYMPKKDCVKVKKNKIKYYDKSEFCNLLDKAAEPKDIGLYGSVEGNACIEWVIEDNYFTVEKLVDVNYKFLEEYREKYRKNIENAEEKFEIAKQWIDYIKQPRLKGNFDSLELYNYEYSNLLTEEEYYLSKKTFQAYEFSFMAEKYKHEAFINRREALISIPFTTVENWLTITKEEMLTKMKAFIEEVKQNK